MGRTGCRIATACLVAALVVAAGCNGADDQGRGADGGRTEAGGGPGDPAPDRPKTSGEAPGAPLGSEPAGTSATTRRPTT